MLPTIHAIPAEVAVDAKRGTRKTLHMKIDREVAMPEQQMLKEEDDKKGQVLINVIIIIIIY